MSRRKRPTIKGSDPEYSHNFEARRQLPTGMPPNVVIPGVDRDHKADEKIQSTASDDDQTNERPAEESESAGLATDEDRNAPSPEGETKPKEPAKPKAEGVNRKVASRQSTSRPQTDSQNAATAQKQTRHVRIKTAITKSHVEAMQPLLEAGFAKKDILAVAGRRMAKRFEPKAEFVPLPDGDRMPLAEGYATSRMLPAALLDSLRDIHDPLRLSSDAAMIRGQFETLFWAILDEVILELSQKKKG